MTVGFCERGGCDAPSEQGRQRADPVQARTCAPRNAMHGVHFLARKRPWWLGRTRVGTSQSSRGDGGGIARDSNHQRALRHTIKRVWAVRDNSKAAGTGRPQSTGRGARRRIVALPHASWKPAPPIDRGVARRARGYEHCRFAFGGRSPRVCRQTPSMPPFDRVQWTAWLRGQRHRSLRPSEAAWRRDVRRPASRFELELRSLA
jgi:hypothetical protein